MLRHSRKHRSAFTLIELLIVIAIIAILALIAIPNFLEAQTRSKVAAVQSNMRTVALGLEAYYVDYNAYPCRHATGGDDSSNNRFGERMFRFGPLSTPVAYLSDIYSSSKCPFEKQIVDQRVNSFRYLNKRGWADWCRANIASPNAWVNGRPTPYWFLVSIGPDIQSGPKCDIDFTNWATWSEVEWFRNIFDTNDPRLKVMQYDPTNGTISNGDIIRFGP